MTVYCLYFPNGKRYVGVESKAGRRINDHKNMASLNKPDRADRMVVHYAVRKHGWENVRWRYLATNCTRDEAYALERTFIRLFRTREMEWGYNRSDGGEGTHGAVVSPERKARRRATLRSRGLHGGEQLNTAMAIAKRVFSRRQNPNVGVNIAAAKRGTIALPAGPNGETRYFKPEQLI